MQEDAGFEEDEVESEEERGGFDEWVDEGAAVGLLSAACLRRVSGELSRGGAEAEDMLRAVTQAVCS